MDRDEIIQNYLDKAWASRRTGDYETSKKHLANAHALCSDTDYLFLGRLFHIYRQHEADHLNYEKALEFNFKSLLFYKSSKNQNRIAHALRHVADLQVQLGQLDIAKSNYEMAIKQYRNLQTVSDIDLSNALRGYALLLEILDQPQAALSEWKEILVLYRRHSFEEGIAEASDKIMQLKM